MPRFDGTGPRGRGPMTGKAEGYCLLKIPDAPGESKTGFAGLAGNAVTIGNDSCKVDIAGMQTRLREVQTALQAMKLRLAAMEAGGRKS